MLHLRLVLKKAKLERNIGNHHDKMDPFVVIRCDPQEWRSSVKQDAGKKPEWHGEWMEIHHHMWGHNIHIEVRD